MRGARWMVYTLVPGPFFEGEEKRPGTICLRIPRKVGIPDIFEYFPFLDRSLPLYARICTTENQTIADPMVSEQKLYKTRLVCMYMHVHIVKE